MKKHLTNSVLNRAVAWIGALEQVLNQYGDLALEDRVRKTGQKILAGCKEISGDRLKRVDALLYATDASFQTALAYIKAVESTLCGHGNAGLNHKAMEAAGQKCAEQMLADCEEILGKRPETVNELLDATNRRRKKYRLGGLWKRQGNQARLRISECNCTLVRVGLVKPNPIHCLCSKGMMESIFGAVCTGPVTAELLMAEGFGDKGCEFCVTFVE